METMSFTDPLLLCAGLGGLGAGAYFLLKTSSQKKAVSEGEDLLQAYTHVAKDPQARVLLQDLTPLFLALDPEVFQSLLTGMNDFCRIYESCRSGDSQASLVARGLRLRRGVLKDLSMLTAEARRKRPIEASNVADDIEGLRKFVEDLLHNVTQEQSLQALR